MFDQARAQLRVHMSVPQARLPILRYQGDKVPRANARCAARAYAAVNAIRTPIESI
jgi:hypothetical protein